MPTFPLWFWLGLAIGLTGLALSAYRLISPKWLLWLLVASGGLAIARYLAMAMFSTSGEPALQRLWFGSTIGLTFPGLVAVDQLVRHPAMTPQKLLKAYAPFFTFSLLALALKSMAVLALTQLAYAGLMGWLALLLSKKVPSRHIQVALWGLVAAFLYIALDGVLLALGVWYRWPFLYSELLTLLAVWWAFETARQHPL